MFSHCISDRHQLRLLEAHHAAELFALADANRAYLRNWLPWLDLTRTPADSLAFIQAGLRQFADGRGFNAGIWIDGKLAGVVGHHPIDWSSRTATLGYWLAESQQGQGFVTASCRAVIDHAFKILQLNKVVIRCAPLNRRCRAIPERLGFAQEGTLREAEQLYGRHIDLAVYGCLRREWGGGGLK